MSMTYTSLLADIENYCERHDATFLAQIPSFISNAEVRIAAENKPFGLQRVVSGNLTSSVMAKPIRWRRTRSFSIVVGGERKYLKLRTYEYCRSFWPIAASTDEPRYYCDYDFEHFLIVPTPNSTYQFELSYYELPEPLSESNQTSWTTQNAPQLLLYGALMEAMPFLKNSERIVEFQGLYDRAMTNIVKEDSERIVDASA
jgi:hypothetical protein